MWKRFTRALRALFGQAISSMEDPKAILEQNLRELNDQIPRMNESIATVKANVTLLERQLKKHRAEYQDVMSKVRAAIQQNRDDIAGNYALRLEALKQSVASTQQELETAELAYQKALEVKKAFMREREKKIQEARDAMQAHERSRWQAKVADALEQFEVGGVDQTHDEMIRRLNETSAKNEARIDLALDSIDVESMRLEEDAEKLRAQDLVAQMKREMGLGTQAPAAQAPAEELRQQPLQDEADPNATQNQTGTQTGNQARQ